MPYPKRWWLGQAMKQQLAWLIVSMVACVVFGALNKQTYEKNFLFIGLARRSLLSLFGGSGELVRRP